MSTTPIRIGMVGGGPGAGIANAHRIGMRLDNRYTLVAGAFSRTLEKSRQTGRELGIDDDRIYEDFEAMAQAEAAREDGIEAVSIVTPNSGHFPAAKAFLEQGIHVVCDKPMTDDLDKAHELHDIAKKSGVIFALTHNYSAYAMVREAAELVSRGVLGKLRMAQVEHVSGWGARAVEMDADNKQAAWRTDPAKGSPYSIVYDMGTHAHHLLRFISGQEVTDVSAHLQTCVEGRQVYDDVRAQVRLQSGCYGVIWSSMAATGEKNGLRIRLYGDKASLEWLQEDPTRLMLRHIDGRTETLDQGHDNQTEAAGRLTRLAMGHPEGYLTSFANLYGDIADAIVRYRTERQAHYADLPYPSSFDGVKGVEFVDAVKRSHEGNSRWTPLGERD